MKKYSIFILLICIISCQSKMTDDVLVIDVTTDQTEEALASKYFSSVCYVALESTKETMLTPWAKYFVSDKDIVAIELQRVLLFDKKTGKFKREVSRRGQGPGEYSHLMGATYYAISNSVLSTRGGDWMAIDCETGMTQTIKKPDLNNLMAFSSNKDKNAELASFIIPILHTIQLQDNLYAGYVHNIDGANPVKLVYYDREGTIIETIPNYLTFENSEDVIIQHTPIFSTSNKSFLFMEKFNDTIFSLNETGATPLYVFNMGNKGLVYSEQGREFEQSNYMVVKGFFEMDNNFFFQYEYQTTTYMGVMNTHTGKVFLCKDGFLDDWNDFLHLYPIQQNMSGDAICIIPAESIVEYFDKGNGVDTSLSYLKDIQSDDNPVVAILTTK